MTGERGHNFRLPVGLQPLSAERKIHNNKSNCYSQPLHDFSKDLMLISKKPESCWLAMAAASCLFFPPFGCVSLHQQQQQQQLIWDQQVVPAVKSL